MSTTNEMVQPPFYTPIPQNIKLSKLEGRGKVTIVQLPADTNDLTLGIRLDDNDFNGGDNYEIRISW
jgi:hypothetical protein